ncbi:MAG: valine--tRNA ligase [Candidatus Marsarchaeota archaeon]|nr:valine--tRNA ligase [Candidatus Marsarchaeota archaeon]
MSDDIVSKWSARWEEMGVFSFHHDDESRRLFVIDPPPPFTDGALHMGQAYWVSYIDALARYKRMRGFNVLYPVGWDMQGFPSEIATEKKYGKSLSRDEFYAKCAELSQQNLDTMKKQMLSLGASFDQSLEYKTLSESYRRKVQLALLTLFRKGMVYRMKHSVSWCTNCVTAISREEIEETEESSTLNTLKFEVGSESIDISTTRPEMLHACVAVAVNPDDERYSKLVGKKATVPIYGRKVPVIADPIVDKGFGTGAEMVCTFGDKNDVLLYHKHGLDLVEAIDERGKLRNSGELDGMSLKDARAKILEKLKEKKLLIETKPIMHQVKKHDRCSTKVELLSSTQWFIKTKDFSDKIIESGKSIRWDPEFAVQRIIDWAQFIEWDWNISRNRIFGTPIPFWYCGDCGEVIAPEEADLPVNPALEKAKVQKCPSCGSESIIGEQATCDNWVDSAITPLIIAGWPDDKNLFEKAYPSTVRIQGSDIVRTWAFYTIFMNWALVGQKPIENMLINGMVLGPDGSEMHKSLGNSIYPEEVLSKYSTDVLRLWVATSGSVGKDKRFSYEEIDKAKAFITKLENSAKFVMKAAPKAIEEQPHKGMGIFDVWILNRLNMSIKSATDAYDSLNLYAASTKLIDFYWHDFCDYYIENVKHRVSDPEKGESARAAAYTLRHVLSTFLQLISPIIPFTAEEINERLGNESLMAQQMPKYAEKKSGSDYVINGVVFSSAIVDIDYEDAGTMLNNVIGEVRKQKAAARIALNKPISSIHINVPEAYYNVVKGYSAELGKICKTEKVSVSVSESYSVAINI